MDSKIINLLLVALIVVYGVFLVFDSIKKFVECTKARRAYVKEHKHQVEPIRDFALWMIGYLLIACFGALGIFLELRNNKDIFVLSAYGFLIVYIFSFLLELITRRTIIFDDEGFFYEKTYYRYRSVNGVDVAKGIIKRYDIRLTTTSDKFQMPAKLAEMLKDHLVVYRKKRKIKK